MLLLASQSPVRPLLGRPGTPAARPEPELPLSDLMRQLDSGKCHGDRAERLEPQHGLTMLFDGPVILLHDVIQISVGSGQYRLPPGIFSAHLAQPDVAREMPIKSDLSRQFRKVQGQRPAEKRLRGSDATIRTQ